MHNKTKVYFWYISVLSLLFLSCNKTTDLEHLLEIKTTANTWQNKTITDVKDHFKIKIGKKWKRELFFDYNQSRIYAADTTRNFLSSFIIDVTEFEGKINLDENFKTQLEQNITQEPRSYMVKKGNINIQKIPGYCLFSFSRQPDFEVYTLTCYLALKEKYFLMTSTIYGSENLTQSLQETISVFNSLTLINKQ